jgi:16S rRNA (guanine(966)-N(2))-methyltransferase RsmD
VSQPRILGGSARGRKLDIPRRGTRPSPARLREALFNLLAFRDRGAFLDLYSGSGAIGLEAASRGWTATCVDLAKDAVRVASANARRLDLEAQIVRADALDFARQHPGRFDIVFAAPPYPLDLAEIFATIVDAGPAAPGGLYVFQHPTEQGSALIERAGRTADVRRYGSNSLSLIAADDTADHGAPQR